MFSRCRDISTELGIQEPSSCLRVVKTGVFMSIRLGKDEPLADFLCPHRDLGDQ